MILSPVLHLGMLPWFPDVCALLSVVSIFTFKYTLSHEGVKLIIFMYAHHRHGACPLQLLEHCEINVNI